jgi:hypothetical protein
VIHSRRHFPTAPPPFYQPHDHSIVHIVPKTQFDKYQQSPATANGHELSSCSHTNKLKAIIAQLKENTTSYGSESSESDVDHTVADIISEMTEMESEFQNTIEKMTRERKYKFMALENEGWKLELELLNMHGITARFIVLKERRAILGADGSL